MQRLVLEPEQKQELHVWLRQLEPDILGDVELEQSKPHLRRLQLERDVLGHVELEQQRKKLADQKQNQNCQNHPTTQNLTEDVVQERRTQLRCEKRQVLAPGIPVDVEQQHGTRVQQRS